MLRRAENWCVVWRRWVDLIRQRRPFKKLILDRIRRFAANRFINS